jgi:MerR family transcriptional regulator/heat shock protein HspR
MNAPIIPRDVVAQKLAISPGTLVRYESLGLVQSVFEGPVQGYEPAEVRRIWTIVSFQRDLGINLAGIEVILHLVDHISQVHHQVHNLADELRTLLDMDETGREMHTHE